MWTVGREGQAWRRGLQLPWLSSFSQTLDFCGRLSGAKEGFTWSLE